MKKLIALLLILSLSLSLFACGQKEQNGTETETETGSSETDATIADVPVSDPDTSFGDDYFDDPITEEEPEAVKEYSITSSTRNDGGLTAKPDPNALTTYPSMAQLSNERKTAEAAMREMMTVLWRADKNYTYQKVNGSEATIKAGQLYKGLPYTNGGGSMYSFSQFFTSQTNGVYNLADLPENWAKFLSNDCWDSIAWSWAKISNSVTATHTQLMTPKYGVIHVGEYEAPEDKYTATKKDCTENGAQVMYKAYAQLQPADAVVHYNDGAGHAMMAVAVHVVYDITYYENPKDRTDRYETSRTINGSKSYVYVHEQKSTGNTQTTENGENCIQTCANDRKVTFSTLYNAGYLPVTCAELRDSTNPGKATFSDSVANPAKNTVTEGVISTNYRVSSVNMVITDADGKAVQSVVRFSNQARDYYSFDLSAFASETVYDTARIDVSSLSAGNYHCTVSLQIATGEVLTVRDFNFAV